MPNDPTYVCDQCAHQWCAPEHPARCESCSANGSWLTPFNDPDRADEYSESILRAEETDRA